jgi:branched-chain amino acid aminotransferase
MEEQKTIWLDGAMTPWRDAAIHITSYGILLGIGYFEALRCFETPAGPALFRLTDHLNRLRETAHTYLATPPYSTEELAAACKAVLVENGLSEGYVRVLMVLGEGENPALAKYRTAIIATAGGPYMELPDEGGMHAKITGIQRPAPNVIPPAAKATGQYLNAYLAQAEAILGGYQNALLLNASGHVVDSWIHNVFTVKGGVLRTPPIHAGALAGITRATVSTLARERDIEVQEVNLVRTDLYNADELFLTGTQAGIIPVISVDRRQVGTGKPGPITETLIELFGDVVHGKVPAHAHWCELVNASPVATVP